MGVVETVAEAVLGTSDPAAIGAALVAVAAVAYVVHWYHWSQVNNCFNSHVWWS